MCIRDRFPSQLVRGIGSVSEYNREYTRSMTHPEEFWSEMGNRLQWRRPFDRAMASDLEHGIVEFFQGGTLNVSENCIDRHLEEKGDQTALLWEKDEPGQQVHISYKELHRNVCRLSNVLKSRGVSKGDVVSVYMPMCPEAVYAMLACARIGAVHSAVSYTHLRAHETPEHLVCRLLLEKKKKKQKEIIYRLSYTKLDDT
eukprot:TRINITY_DN28922_c0_g1_i1.p1 TRINITY_DN28922_c0_g1~~TRINITY_DN28922_c0_g1_i1.p1  ORF type:complete len:200 (-),score=59.56 TRINITY_DN28922_c0_g1_i1:33-632(-)